MSEEPLSFRVLNLSAENRGPCGATESEAAGVDAAGMLSAARTEARQVVVAWQPVGAAPCQELAGWEGLEFQVPAFAQFGFEVAVGLGAVGEAPFAGIPEQLAGNPECDGAEGEPLDVFGGHGKI